MSLTRIYLVRDTATGAQRLIRAGNQAQAVRHAARSQFNVEVAGQDDLVVLIAAGTVVEDAGTTVEDEQLPLEPQA